MPRASIDRCHQGTRGGSAGMWRSASTTISAPIGTLTKTRRASPVGDKNRPPKIGPIIAPTGRCCRTGSPRGRARAKMVDHDAGGRRREAGTARGLQRAQHDQPRMSSASPHASDASVKVSTEPTKTRRRP